VGTIVEQGVPPLEAGDHLTRAEFLRRWEAHPEIKKAELIGGIVFMPPPASLQLREGVPPLCPGDKLTRAEFLRRWEAHPEITKAELIGGMVFMPSPVTREHGVMDGDVGIWLGTYRMATPGTETGHNTTSLILEETPQPDNFLRILPEYGGRSRDQGKYLGGRPELLAEISGSSASYDLHAKLELYEAARIPEYLAVLLFEKEVRWHVLVGRRYQLLSPDRDGLLRSRIFPGLWLDSKALLERNLQKVLTRLQEGLNSPEHQRFVAKLARRKRARTQGK
jgi:Uma2 family endonuclease